MDFLIGEYIKKITEEDIYNFAVNEGVKLLNDEVKTIYVYIKNYWRVFLHEDPTFLFEELKDKLSEKAYNKAVELYNKYKKK